MKQLTYEERVQDIARKMSMRNYGKWGPGLPTWVQSMDDASLAVAEMAEQFNNGWSCGVMHGIGHSGYDDKEKLMRDLGLIPDEKEVRNDI